MLKQYIEDYQKGFEFSFCELIAIKSGIACFNRVVASNSPDKKAGTISFTADTVFSSTPSKGKSERASVTLIELNIFL